MSFFGNILEKLGLRRPSTASQTTKAKPPTSQHSGPGGAAAPQRSANRQESPAPQGSERIQDDFARH